MKSWSDSFNIPVTINDITRKGKPPLQIDFYIFHFNKSPRLALSYTTTVDSKQSTPNGTYPIYQQKRSKKTKDSNYCKCANEALE